MRRTFLFLSQVYLPDPASVGQHLADAAAELVRRGHRVVVLTSNRGYDDPRWYIPGGRPSTGWKSGGFPGPPSASRRCYTTLLEAAKRLRDVPNLVILFVVGGTGKREVEESAGPNVLSLPYQPLSELKYSLSAADVHVVTVGDGIVGIVHPSKVYGALAVARPVLLVGPAECHVTDILEGTEIGWRVSQGDVDGAERVLREIAQAHPAELARRGAAGRRVVQGRLSKAALCGRFCDVLERGITLPNAVAGSEWRNLTGLTVGPAGPDTSADYHDPILRG
jgi:glycosyltransferase involved in cell wall biosynthesis